MMCTPAWIVEPAPIFTSSPIVAKGCTLTSAPSMAVGLTAASRLIPTRFAVRRGRKWLTMRENAWCESSTWMAGVPSGTNDRGQTTADARLPARLRARSVESIIVIWPGKASCREAAP